MARELAGLRVEGVPSALAVTLAIALVGRVVLSVLPAGLVGGHGWRDLPATWAASHVLGLAVLGVSNALLELLPLFDAVAGRRAALLAPWVLVALGRIATLPGAMVPRHAPREQRLAGAARTLPLLAVLLVALAGTAAVASAAEAGSSPAPSRTPLGALLSELGVSGGAANGVLAASSWAAAVVLLSFGLRVARRAPAERAGLAALVAATPMVAHGARDHADELAAASFLIGGAVFAIAWLRRADRRSRLLAMVVFTALPLASWNGLVLGGLGLVALVAFTPRVSRRPLLFGSIAAWLLVAWPLAGRFADELAADEMVWVAASPIERLRAALDVSSFGFGAALVLAGLALSVAVLARRLGRVRAAPADAIDEPLRELAFAVALAIATLFALAPGWARLPDADQVAAWSRLGLLMWLPLGALAGGLALARSERA